MALVLCCGGGVSGQPVACSSKNQCGVGSFCDKSARVCRECILCEDLKREPKQPLPQDDCIKSVGDCGGCLAGLMVNLHGDVNSACVPVAGSADSSSSVLPTYVWVLITIALMFFLLIVGIVVYVLRNKETIKMIFWTEREFSEPPPPYNLRYTAVPPAPPMPPNPTAPTSAAAASSSKHSVATANVPDIDASEGPDTAFIKDNTFPDHGNVVERDGKQAAFPYNPPAYMQADPPHSNEVSPVNVNDINENPMLHDEDTMESVWSPYVAENDTGDTANGNSSLVPVGPPAKRFRLNQDTNNNREASGNDNGSGAFPCSPSPTESKPSFVINVVQINNNK